MKLSEMRFRWRLSLSIGIISGMALGKWLSPDWRVIILLLVIYLTWDFVRWWREIKGEL